MKKVFFFILFFSSVCWAGQTNMYFIMNGGMPDNAKIYYYAGSSTTVPDDRDWKEIAYHNRNEWYVTTSTTPAYAFKIVQTECDTCTYHKEDLKLVICTLQVLAGLRSEYSCVKGDY